MLPSPTRRQAQADALTGGNPPMSPGSSGELSPFDLLGEIGDEGPGSPTDDCLDGNHHDSVSGQKWDSHTEIAEQAKHEAKIENRIAELRKEGFWTPRRLSKFPEPTRPKVQWDYLCEEMQWLAADFAQERRWKRGVARKVVRMVVRHHEELKQKEERARREEQAKLRRIATSIAKEVRQFWSNVEKVVQFKQQSRLEAKRKKALDLQLDFIVGQTEKYSDLLSQSLNESMPMSKTSSSCVGSSQGGSLRTSPTPSVCQKDGDFLPHANEEEEEDDEETIEIEERQDGNDEESHRLELELLKRESELPLDELLQSLPPEILKEEADLEGAESEHDDNDDDSEEEEEEEEVVVEGDDDEFTANEEEAEDEEETIAAEEAMEGQQDHEQELSQLAKEGEMSIEDLLKKYSLVRTDEEETLDQSESSLPSEQEASDYSECDSSDCESDGVEFLVKQEDEEAGTDHSQNEPPEPKKEITDIAATAESLQPKGYTLATTQVKTPVPFLLRGDLREYQHIGLEWLVTMYEKKLNGILADEMGLGKTIQTISLLAHLACERGNWGPHLIIVPTSVILNWEMELKRWCPSFKILTYYGSQKERKLKRQGWTKANAFHVCITSYKLVLQDHQAFRRKNWRYLILDEAQNIKNFKSQRWQSLLNFNSQRRLLLTGTPLQNSLMELWSLMHFLMPHVFQSHREFKEWFSNPLTGMIEGSQEYNEGLVRRLHKVLRPFLLRRIKLDVEKQMPKKYEHVIYCRLSKRQRFLYDDFMSQAATRESLASGHFMSVINILMQLRKVCNHPNLFDPRPIHSPFITSAICYSIPSLVLHTLQRHPLEFLDTSLFDLVNMEGRVSRYESDVFLSRHKPSRQLIQEIADSPEPPPRPRPLKMKVNRMLQPVVKPESRSVVVVNSSRPVQKLQDPPTAPSPTAPSPPAPPSTPLPPAQSNPPLPTAGVSGAALPAPQVTPLVQPSPVTLTTTPVSSESGKPTPLQNSQPVYSAPQRFILTPDMQARLPSGEVISLSQLASLSGRPLQSPSVTKPLTLQLQGGKFTLSGAQVRPVGVSQPRPMQGNVLHLVSSGGQHHLLSQPAQLALIQALAQQAASSAPTASAAQLLQNNVPAHIGVQAMSVQGLQHSLLNSANIPPPSGPALTAPGQVSGPGVVKIVVRQAPREVQSSLQRPPLAPQVRPILRVLPVPHAEQTNLRDGSGDRAAPVVATSTITLASSPLLMVSSSTVTPRLPAPSPMALNTDDSSAPPLSGVALRLVATRTSPAVQLTNHRSSPPGHTASPALMNSSPCATLNSVPSNCTTTQLIGGSDSCPRLGLQKSSQNPDTSLLDSHPVQNGNGLQKQLGDSSSSGAPITCVPSTVNSPSPPASTIPKVSPPTYNLSLVPALIANSASSNTARFLTSPLSLLALSPLASTNSGPTPVIYTPPNAAAFPTLSAPLPAASVSASLPLLAAPSLSAPLPAASVSASLPLLAAPSLSAPLPAASVSASLPLLAAPMSGQLTSFAAPLPISSANQTAMTVPHPSVETPSTRPVFSTVVAPSLPAPTPGHLPVLSTPTSATLFAAAASASMLEGSSNQPVLLSSDSTPMPLLDTSSADTLPPLVLNTPLKLPSMTSAPVPILPAPVSNAVPLLAAASSKVSIPLLSVTSASTNVPLLSASAATRVSSVPVSTPTTCVPNQPASVRAPAAVASVMYTTCVSSVTNSSSPLLSTSNSLPSLLPKASAPLLTVQLKAPSLLPSGLVEAPTPMSSVPAEVPASCTRSAEAPAPLLPSSAVASTLMAPVPIPGSSSIQSVVPTVQIKAPAPLPSLLASTVTPSMPASAPLPSLPASTPIHLPLLTASTPTPVSSLPASSPDPSSLLPVSAPGQAPDLSSPPVLAPSVDHAPVSLLPSSGTNPLVISVSAPLTLTASAPSRIPLLPSQPPDGIMLPKSAPSHSNISTSPRPANPTNSPDTASTIPTSVVNQESKNFPESSLSLSIAGPPPAGVTLSTALESEITLEGEESRIAPSATYNTSVRPRRLLPPPPRSPFYLEPLEERRKKQKMERLERIFHLNERRCSLSPVYGTEVLSVCTLPHSLSTASSTDRQTHALTSCVFTSEQRLQQLQPIIERFIISMPPVEAPQITLHTSHPPPSMLLQESLFRETLSRELTPNTRCLHRIISNMRTQFPDLRLIQYDCGKLQTLHRLLRELKSGGHRVLLFTQMTRMLDVLEQFLNYHGHIYLRLDGSTRVEQRQVLMERFNMDKRIFCFILSTRSGGVGVNLTGADTVIFYDSDWNPTMDAQAQDRCHRIGQTRDVHIYRLVSERTVEENILKKAQQKRMLGDMAIEGGNFTTAYFKQQTIRELFDMEDIPRKESEMRSASPAHSTEDSASLRPSHILEQALCRAEDEEDTLAASLVRAEQVADLAEFNENVPLEPEEEEQSRVEQEISALVEQLTPIERYAMYFLEASLEEVSREELKQAEEQVEAARKDLILAKDDGGQNIEEKWEEDVRKNRKVRTPTPARTPGERVGVRMSERLRGNKAADPTDIAESIAVPEVSLSAQEVNCEVSTQTLEGPSFLDVDNGVHDAETSHNAAVTTEPIMSSIAPPVPQTEESSTEFVKQEAEDVGVAHMEEEECVSVPSAELMLGRSETCEPTLSSPVTTPQEEPTPPRTPRRKVTADCEILLAGANESSPAAKVLRRLPGRLVTVVQERLPAARRHVRVRGQQATLDNGALSPNNPECQSPPHDLLSEDNSETGSPPPKRKRGRPPKASADMSPTAVPDLPREDRSPDPHPSAISDFSPSSLVQTPASPKFSSKPNSENESSSAEKRKRGRPPKRREASPATSPIASPIGALQSPVMVSTLGAIPSSPICASPTSSIIASPTPPTSVLGDAARDPSQSEPTEASSFSFHIKASDRRQGDPHFSSLKNPTAKFTIPIDSFNIPSVSGEATSSSGADEPVTPSKRRRGRPPRSQIVSKRNSSVTSHNYKLDSSPDRSPSPKVTTRACQRKPLKADTTDSKEQNSSLADTDDSSEDEEVVKRTPLTRSARSRLETDQTLGVSPKPQRGRSPRVTPIPEKPTTKRRKPPSTSSPSPPSSSPHGSSSGKQKVARKKHNSSPPERVLRSSLTANPASNTRSSRSQLVYFPSSNRGRKAKT